MTEFNDAEHYGFFITGPTLTSQTGKYVRQSELTLAALRAAGVLSSMVDGVDPPATDKLWLDKNYDPAILKEWDATGSSWAPITFDRLFGRAAVTPMAAPGGTADALIVAAPMPFMNNRLYSLTPALDNTGAVTVDVPGVGIFPATYMDGSELEAREFSAGRPTILFFDGIGFRVMFAVSAVYDGIVHAREWAINPEDDPIGPEAGGDGTTTFSALHWAKKAEQYSSLARNDWVVKRFAGNGVTTSFTLDVEPGSAANCFVAINGVTQQTNTYSVSGTTLTFTTAPPGDGAEQNIETRVGNSVTMDIGTPSDDSVTTAKLVDGSVTEAKLGAQAVSSAKLKDGAATRSKIGDAAINAAKLTDSSSELAAIVTKLGIVPSKVVNLAFLPADNTATTTTTTTSLGGSLTGALGYSPVSATSKVLCVAITRVRVEGTAVNDHGARVGLYRFNDSAYVAPATLFFANDLLATDNAAGNIIRDFTMTHAAVIIPSERRSNGAIAVRTMGNTVYAGTLTHQSTFIFFIEFE